MKSLYLWIDVHSNSLKSEEKYYHLKFNAIKKRVIIKIIIIIINTIIIDPI